MCVCETSSTSTHTYAAETLGMHNGTANVDNLSEMIANIKTTILALHKSSELHNI